MERPANQFIYLRHMSHSLTLLGDSQGRPAWLIPFSPAKWCRQPQTCRTRNGLAVLSSFRANALISHGAISLREEPGSPLRAAAVLGGREASREPWSDLLCVQVRHSGQHEHEARCGPLKRPQLPDCNWSHPTGCKYFSLTSATSLCTLTWL